MNFGTGGDHERILELCDKKIFFYDFKRQTLSFASELLLHKNRHIVDSVIIRSSHTISVLTTESRLQRFSAAIPYEELDINMGERWIDSRLYAAFASELFGADTNVMYFLTSSLFEN